MSDKELVKRLRASRAVWENGRSHPTDDEAEAADRIEALTAKLAKAVEGLREIAGFAEKEWVTPSGEAPPDVQNLCDIARATLAEIEGKEP